MSKLLLLAAVALTAAPDTTAQHHDTMKGVAPDEAILRLMEGNGRFTSGEVTHPNQNANRRQQTARTQSPFAIIVTCSDSRVVPEFIFDQGIGDLFVVRVAGNTVDPLAIGSIEYAVAHLNSQLIVVMGHERCGAVSAALGEADGHGHLDGSLPAVVEGIRPAVATAKGQTGDLLENAIKANVRNMVAKLSESNGPTAARVKAGSLRVIGMRYDLDTGSATIVR